MRRSFSISFFCHSELHTARHKFLQASACSRRPAFVELDELSGDAARVFMPLTHQRSRSHVSPTKFWPKLRCGSVAGSDIGFDGVTAGQSRVPIGLTNIIAIAAGGWHSLALRADRTIVAWGDNSRGQIAVPSGLGDVLAVAGGGFHTLALKSDGTVVAWGWKPYGQTNVPVGLSNVVSVAAGPWHSLALRNDGIVIGWGGGEFGEGKIFRPNRDVRFSADKSPYKTNIAAMLAGGGYIQFSAEGLGAGNGFYVMAPDQLDRYRL